jgi:hypothetical protein
MVKAMRRRAVVKWYNSDKGYGFHVVEFSEAISATRDDKTHACDLHLISTAARPRPTRRYPDQVWTHNGADDAR